jgi:hypothetical protein
MQRSVKLCLNLLAILALSGTSWRTATGDEPAAEPAAGKVSVDVARDRAEVLHDVFLSTLHVMHDHYFHEEKAMVPARAMEDVFANMARHQQIKAHWISVNTRPMSINHEPKSDFEKLAAKELASGKETLEQIDQGEYRRAAPVALDSGCIACHTGFFSPGKKSPKFAGLVITIPLAEAEKK